MRFILVWLGAIIALATPLNAEACGVESDCRVGNRSYRVHLPPGNVEGAIVFAHGYRGSAAGVMKNRSLLSLADELNVALVALDARGHDWNIDGVPSHSIVLGTDEFEYVGDVLDDAISRFQIDPKRLLATGFSAGGMLIWNLACHMPERIAGFAPIAGTFWHPVPAECQAPAASLIHIHGRDDPVVPLRGRAIADTHQGDVFKAIEMYAQHGEFGVIETRKLNGLSCRQHRSPAQRRLDLCLFDGGHSFKTDFVRLAWRELIEPR